LGKRSDLVVGNLPLQVNNGLERFCRGLALLHRAQPRFDALGQPFAGGTGQTLNGFLDPTIGADPVADGLLSRLPSQGQRQRVGRC
jgi:hypothetical protein